MNVKDTLNPKSLIAKSVQPPKGEYASRLYLWTTTADKITANQFENIRDMRGIDELAEMILADGLNVPLVVQKTSNGYRLIDGFRRFTAIKFLIDSGKIPAGTEIKVEILPEDTTELQIDLRRFTSRGDELTPLEQAKYFNRLKGQYNLKATEISEKLGISHTKVNQGLDLLALPSDVIESIENGEITISHALEVIKNSKAEAKKNLEKNGVKPSRNAVKVDGILAAAEIIRNKRSDKRPKSSTEAMLDDLSSKINAKETRTYVKKDRINVLMFDITGGQLVYETTCSQSGVLSMVIDASKMGAVAVFTNEASDVISQHNQGEEVTLQACKKFLYQ